MNPEMHGTAFRNHEVGARVHSVCGSAYLWVGAHLILAAVIGVSTVFAQTKTSSSPKRDVAVAHADSAARSADTLNVILPSEAGSSSSAPSKQIVPRRSSLRREEPFAYDSRGRRDAFRPLISERKRDENIETDLLIVNGAVLTGVVWSGGQHLAMVRDKDGNNFFLREGDAVFRGRVATVTQTKAVFRLVEFGEIERVTLTVRADENKKDNK